ncbi:MAG TPA: M48 family metalloprotease [Steroidobacteraceae bacterium]|jgi:predicted Zn-dependent protease|nr:M48 family metalloprotease [Steroidobacteraceae bacterium]
MRAALVVLLTALVAVATVAAGAEPPGNPVDLTAPTAGSNLPDLGSPAETVLSKTDEFRLGAMVAKELRDQNALLEDPEVSEYLTSVEQRLAAQSAEGGRGFQSFLVKDNEVNAFAVPGGYLFVNSGLVLVTNTESELAAVMAHETAHDTQHHIARAIRAQSQQSMLSAAAMIAAILLGAMGGSNSGQAVEGGIAAAQGLAIQSQINFTRDEEKEADRVGMGYLYGAGFDPNAMGDMFETLGRSQGLAATYIPAMLMDHPVTSDRIAEARARAAQFPPRKGHDSLTFELIRERVRVLTATGDVDMAQQYADKIARGETGLGNRYGEGLALMLGTHADQAVPIFAQLVKQHEQLTLLHVALAQAEAKAGHTREALATFKHAEELFPRNVPVTVRYAETLMAAGRPAEAHTMLLDLFNNVPPTPDQIRLTALAASAAGDPGDAYFYMGEYQIAGGDLLLAVQQLQLALAAPNISLIQRQRYQARLDEVRDYLASVRKPKLTDNGDSQGQGRGGSGH